MAQKPHLLLHTKMLAFISIMLVKKKNIEEFYNELRSKFPNLNELKTWDENDWSVDGGIDHCAIMTDIAREVRNWSAAGQLGEIEKLFQIIETYWNEGDSTVTSYIYTDFLVTIMEIKKEQREPIKALMKATTQQEYNNLLHLYRESIE